jgi:hypothetical protein
VSREADPLIRRLERDAVIFGGLATAAALVVRPDAPRIAAGVAGGGLLALASLMAIRSTVDALLARIQAAAPTASGPPTAAAPGVTPAPDDATPPGAVPARAGAGLGLKLAGRYLVLGLAAYVMIARLRLHAVGVLIGASSLVAAASFEAIRTMRRSQAS